jgi:hypothetical protein
VNNRSIDQVTNTTLTHGEIGVLAYPTGNQTKVAYNNAKVWTL